MNGGRRTWGSQEWGWTPLKCEVPKCPHQHAQGIRGDMLESKCHSQEANAVGEYDYQTETALVLREWAQQWVHGESKDLHFCLPHSWQGNLSVLLYPSGHSDPKESNLTNIPILLVTSPNPSITPTSVFQILLSKWLTFPSLNITKTDMVTRTRIQKRTMKRIMSNIWKNLHCLNYTLFWQLLWR